LSASRPAGHGNSGTTVQFNSTLKAVELIRPGQDIVFLDMQCTKVLVYPDQVQVFWLLTLAPGVLTMCYSRLKNSRREELALIGSQFWLFLVGFHAVRTTLPRTSVHH
jgi:hypothetical protein